MNENNNEKYYLHVINLSNLQGVKTPGYTRPPHPWSSVMTTITLGLPVSGLPPPAISRIAKNPVGKPINLLVFSDVFLTDNKNSYTQSD